MADDGITSTELGVIIVVLLILIVIPLSIICCCKCCSGVINFWDDYKQSRKRQRRNSGLSKASSAGKSSSYQAEKLAVVEGHERLAREAGIQLDDYPFIIDYSPAVVIPGLPCFTTLGNRPESESAVGSEHSHGEDTTASLNAPSPDENLKPDSCVVTISDDGEFIFY